MLNKLKKINLKKTISDIFLADSDDPAKVASALSLGVFIAVIPIYGFQSIIAVALSHLLRLNKAIVFLATNISWPPMVFGLIYTSYQTGFMLFNGTFNYAISISSQTASLDDLGESLYLFLVGSVVFGILLSSIVWMLTRGVFMIIKKR